MAHFGYNLTICNLLATIGNFDSFTSFTRYNISKGAADDIRDLYLVSRGGFDGGFGGRGVVSSYATKTGRKPIGPYMPTGGGREWWWWCVVGGTLM